MVLSVEGKFKDLDGRLKSLAEEFKIFNKNLHNMQVDLELMAKRGEAKMYKCKYYKDGYCYYWYWTVKPQGLSDDEYKVGFVNGEMAYFARVEKRPTGRLGGQVRGCEARGEAEGAPSNLALIGVYFFRDPDLVERAFTALKPSWGASTRSQT